MRRKIKPPLGSVVAVGLLHLLIGKTNYGHAKGLVGKLPGNPASCPEEPCNSDPQHVLYALKWMCLFLGLIFLLPVLMYFLSKLYSKLVAKCTSKKSPMDGEKQKKRRDADDDDDYQEPDEDDQYEFTMDNQIKKKSISASNSNSHQLPQPALRHKESNSSGHRSLNGSQLSSSSVAGGPDLGRKLRASSKPDASSAAAMAAASRRSIQLANQQLNGQQHYHSGAGEMSNNNNNNKKRDKSPSLISFEANGQILTAKLISMSNVVAPGDMDHETPNVAWSPADEGVKLATQRQLNRQLGVDTNNQQDGSSPGAHLHSGAPTPSSGASTTPIGGSSGGQANNKRRATQHQLDMTALQQQADRQSNNNNVDADQQDDEPELRGGGGSAGNGSPAAYQVAARQQRGPQQQQKQHQHQHRYSLFMEPGNLLARQTPNQSPSFQERQPQHPIEAGHLNRSLRQRPGSGRRVRAPGQQQTNKVYPEAGDANEAAYYEHQNNQLASGDDNLNQQLYDSPTGGGGGGGGPSKISVVSDLYQNQQLTNNQLSVPSLGPQHRHSIDGSILNNMVHGLHQFQQQPALWSETSNQFASDKKQAQPTANSNSNHQQRKRSSKNNRSPKEENYHNNGQEGLIMDDLQAPLDLQAIKKSAKRRQGRQQLELEFRAHQQRLAEYEMLSNHYYDDLHQRHFDNQAGGQVSSEQAQRIDYNQRQQQQQPPPPTTTTNNNNNLLMVRQKDRRPSLNAAAMRRTNKH